MGWDAWVRFRAGAKDFYLRTVSYASGAHPVSYLMGTGVPFPGSKAGFEADH
jgi:hypothetical protein